MRTKHGTTIIATRGVKEYRATIPLCVARNDVVLEVGCEWGTTTSIIAEHCNTVLGVDVGEECIARARQKYPHIRFEVADGFDVRRLLSFGLDFNKIYVDISGLSGYASLLDLLSLLEMYTAVFAPQIIVVKSSALKFLAMRCVPWRDGVESLDDLLSLKRR